MTTVKFRRTDDKGLCRCICPWCIEHHRRMNVAGFVYRTAVTEPGRCKWHGGREAPQP